MRIFHKTGSTITEFTEEVKKYGSGSKTISYLAGDYIYIASDFPFNHLYFKLGTQVNDEVTDISINYWAVNNWHDVVNFKDGTNGLGQSGFIEVTPDRNFSWELESTNYGGSIIPDLQDITVYDQYWMRISFSVDLDDVDFDWIGNLFSDDVDLYAEYPVFNDTNFLTCFAATKTDWQEQHVKAADLIIQDLKKKKVILDAGQVLDRYVFLPASVSKVAEIIYNAFGRDYIDKKVDAINDYNKRLDLNQFVVDKDIDGFKDLEEVIDTQGWLSR